MRTCGRWSFSIAIVVALALSAAAEEKVERIAWQTDLDNAWHSTRADHKLLLVYVKSDNCVYCEKMERESYGDAAVKQLISEAYVPASLHATRQPDLTRKMGIQAFPTTVVIDSDGQLLDAVEGYVPPTKFADWLKRLSARRRTAAQ